MSFERQEAGGGAAVDGAVAHQKVGADSRVHELGSEAAPAKVGARSLTEQLPIQRKATMAGAAGAPTETGGGAPLPDGVRTSMESSFGADFSSVRVHEGGNAAAFGAQAYAQGENLHFQPGAFNPGSQSGRELIGHELAHVVQQREGRVAMPQGKGDPINADASLEAEADAQGARAARGEPAGNAASLRGPASGGPVQRKVVFGGQPNATTEQIIQALTELGVMGRAASIFATELSTKPKPMQEKLKGLAMGDGGFQQKIVEAWRVGPGEHAYQREAGDGERLLQDSFKNFLHSEHNWRNIGVAQYMTGDATGLAIAPLVDPDVTVEVITGRQLPTEKGPSFVDNDNNDKLPGYFAGAEKGGNIVRTPNNNDQFSGTQEHYAKRFNPYVGKEKVQPWNKETWEATKVIGDAYKDPEKRKIVQSQLQLGDSQEAETAKEKIAEYKTQRLDPQVGGRPCVFLWGRRSGEKGGAHKELDSHAKMLLQIATKIRGDFPGHMIVLVGDEVITVDDLARAGIANQTMALGAFWNDPEYGQYLKDRNAQRELFKLFDEQNQAVSIGMRSGSLEGMALLGLRVVFLDDQGNNAEGRMEMWSGSGAQDRGQKVRDGATDEELDKHEDDTKGPMETYKRVGTLMTLGDQVDVRSGVLTTVGQFVATLLSDVDHNGLPICPPKGNTTGDGILAAAFGTAYNDNLLVGKMPTKGVGEGKKAKTPGVLAREFTAKLQQFMDNVEPAYKEKPEIKPTTFGSNTEDIEAMEKAIARDLQGDAQGDQALELLAKLRTMKDLLDVALVGEQDTGGGALGLFGNLLKKARANQPVTSDDAKKFVDNFGKMGKAMPGKEIDRPRFTRARMEGVQLGITTLESNNVLQPDELQQISYLTKSLSKPKD